mgnify:CR=1 FL=1
MPADELVPDAGDVDSDAGGTDSDDTIAPSDAFQALGGETRLAVVHALATADESLAFSDLFAATDEDTTAGFAYHLRQLAGEFVRQREDERYELTDAGRAAARDVRAGTYTERVNRDPFALEADCPLCEESALTARVVDNVTEIRCGACESTLSRLSLPPSGYAGRDGEEFVGAVDAHHRNRIESFADGVCPECAGTVETTVEPAVDGPLDPVGSDGENPDRDRESADGDSENPDAYDHRPRQVAFACETCGTDLSCPVALATLDHPAVVAFYHDHDEDIGDRPLWNVGSEWREGVVSTDPLCVAVSTRLDDEILTLYVAGDATVVGHRRTTAVDAAAGTPAASGDDFEDDDSDDPDGGSRPLVDHSTGEAAESDEERLDRATDEPEVTDSPPDGATA